MERWSSPWSVVYLLINPDAPVLTVGGIDLCTAVAVELGWQYTEAVTMIDISFPPLTSLCHSLGPGDFFWEWLVYTGRSLCILPQYLYHSPISYNHWRILLEICSLSILWALFYVWSPIVTFVLVRILKSSKFMCLIFKGCIKG